MSTISPPSKGEQPSASPRRQETRARLVDAAVQVIAERGVMGASVEQICEAAGFTRGAFYSNFATKEELWAAVLSDFLNRHVAAARQMTREVPDAPQNGDAEAVASLIDMAIERFVEIQPVEPEWPVINAELRLHAIRNPDFRPIYAEIQAEIQQQLIDLLAPAFKVRGLRLPMPLPQAINLIAAVHNSAQLEAEVSAEPSQNTAADMKALLHSILQA